MNRLLSRGAVGTGTTAAAAFALAAFSLAACTADPGPILTETPSSAGGASPSVSASLSASASASPTPLTDAELLALMPPDAAFPDVRGAIATARYFLDEYTRIYSTGEFRIWDALSRPDCIFCESARSQASDLHSAGAHRDGGEFTVSEGSIQGNYYADTGYTYVILDAQWISTNDIYPDGSVVPDGDGGSAQISLEMELVDGVWRVRDVGVEETT